MIERKIHKLDAKDVPFGRLSTKIATLLRGKHKVTYTPHIDNGDFVVVENVDDIKITGKKLVQKKYFSHSGFPGGLKTKQMKDLSKEKVLRTAVFEMLPNNKTRKNIITRLSFRNK